MDIILEKRRPDADLEGLCECFISESPNRHAVAKPHIHQHFELLYCLSGSYRLTVEHQSFELHEGDAALIHPMEPHQTCTLDKDDNSYIVLKFIPETLYSASQPMFDMKYIFPYLHFSEQKCYVYTADQLEGSDMEKLLRYILAERAEEQYGYELALRAYVSQVLIWFLRAWHKGRHAAVTDEKSLVRLQAAIRYIDDHLDEEIRTEEVAAALSMGLSTFSRFFSAVSGMSFPAYVRTRRLGRAAELLIRTELSITDIALETGFSSASYLTLCFRTHYHLTPTRFRRKLGLRPETIDPYLRK
ncbi:MAG: AraC family transcriptional regulator [Clostridia bacterium]|nr:AraC family transcriptional regulator [Clostridia bacterium]